MKIRYAFVLGIVLLSGVAPASAGVFDNIRGYMNHLMGVDVEQDMSQNAAYREVVMSQPMVSDRVKSLSNIQNIGLMDQEMERYKINAISVQVEDTNEKFYLVKGRGYVERYNEPVDIRVKCTGDDINEVAERVEDGKLGILERIEVMNKMKNKVEYSRVQGSMFNFCLAGGVTA